MHFSTFHIIGEKLLCPSLYLYFLGTITTSVTVYCLIAILVNRPMVQKKMADEITDKIGSRTPRLSDRKILVYIEAAILEVLRYSSITPVNIPHCTMQETTMNGYEIPKDTEVLVSFQGSAHMLW